MDFDLPLESFDNDLRYSMWLRRLIGYFGHGGLSW